MAEMLTEVYERLSASRRNREFLTAMVRNVEVQKLNLRNEENGNYEPQEIECVIFALGGGALGYCPAQEFSEYEYRTLSNFTGTVHEFVVLNVDRENNLASVSVRQADEIKKEKFLTEIFKLEEEGALSEKTFDGIVTGRNDRTRTIFLKVEGTPCFMKFDDLDHERVFDIDAIAGRNKVLPVKVKRFNQETRQIQVSRKAAVPDPFEELADKEPNKYTSTGVVTNVSERDGIFVRLAKGLTIKASKPREIEQPIVDDIVAVRIVSIDKEKRTARGIIFNYPQGKKHRKDVTSWLYE
ncbi:RNA-binding protein [Bacillus cereus]|nr:RNA-binding protein [Bacillus cereus]